MQTGQEGNEDGKGQRENTTEKGGTDRQGQMRCAYSKDGEAKRQRKKEKNDRQRKTDN